MFSVSKLKSITWHRSILLDKTNRKYFLDPCGSRFLSYQTIDEIYLDFLQSRSRSLLWPLDHPTFLQGGQRNSGNLPLKSTCEASNQEVAKHSCFTLSQAMVTASVSGSAHHTFYTRVHISRFLSPLTALKPVSNTNKCKVERKITHHLLLPDVENDFSVFPPASSSDSHRLVL